ncbi:MAG: hypothetical protein ABEJ82_08175 [Haloplanus sp.]
MPSFRTKRGRCHLDGDALRLESSLRGQLRRYREGNRLLFWSYLLALCFRIGSVGWSLLAGEYRLLLLVAVAALAVVGVGYASNYVRGFTREDEIPVDAIEYVTAVEGTTGLTRPRFVVVYDRAGRTRRRYVMMGSTWLSDGEAEFERAKETFRAAGVRVETA